MTATGESASGLSILREEEDEEVEIEEEWTKGQMHGRILQTSSITVMYEEERSGSRAEDGEKSSIGLVV